jgi:MFS family permease
MPFYFQAALNQSPLKSGVSYMSLAVPQMIGLIVGGGVTTVTGHYMPVILVAQVLCGTGAGLLTTITTSTSTALWATFMVLCGLGLGLGVNVPHIAIQAVMETDNDVFIANGIASFFGQLGGSLGVPIGNAILIGTLKSNVPQKAPGISPDAVIDAGALALSSLTTSETLVAGLRQAWAVSVGHVNIFLVAIICISVPTACGMKWLNIKTISREREQQKKHIQVENGSHAVLDEETRGAK